MSILIASNSERQPDFSRWIVLAKLYLIYRPRLNTQKTILVLRHMLLHLNQSHKVGTLRPE